MSSASGPAFGALYTSDQLPHNGRTDIGLASARGDLEEVERSVLHCHAVMHPCSSHGLGGDRLAQAVLPGTVSTF